MVLVTYSAGEDSRSPRAGRPTLRVLERVRQRPLGCTARTPSEKRAQKQAHSSEPRRHLGGLRMQGGAALKNGAKFYDNY